MLQHIVLMKLKPNVTAAQTAALMAALRDLEIPGIVSVVGGANNSPEGLSQGYDFGFVVTFADAAARDAYLPHPAHRDLAHRHVIPLVDGIAVFDFEV